ncbi:hypothetical protein GOP47_0003839 [Adiantum capillus-veneris]|uniref:ATP-dependent RNA helicase n=1 Tax=Adiantum capillus-veneris TaxID=13818 RepID=A0A9D4V6D6_ADICA|nr:hypothetical protein GOP47_0003839 [Adiantum capillus-veneris]
MFEKKGAVAVLAAVRTILRQSEFLELHLKVSTGWVRSFHSCAQRDSQKQVNAPSQEAIARAQASVFEIGKLLLGFKEDRENLFDIDEAQSPNSKSLTSSSFDEVSLSPLSLKALHDAFGYKTMTPMQEATLATILQGNDVVVKAKAGSGKTLAYLLPAIEVLLEACPSSQRAGTDIFSLVLCPSRELALQIFTQAQTLLKYHTDFNVKVLTGGFRISKEREKLQCSSCPIVVATPGRLLDHLEKTEGFKERLGKLKMFVLDEADHVLDVGFRKTVEGILRYLPTIRQTLLFSATIPKEIQSISKIALKDGHKFIDMVELSGSTIHEQVKQKCIVAPVEKHLPVLHEVFKEHITLNSNYKVLVFCITARITAFMHQLFKDLGFNCCEIHSKKGQMSRFHTSKDFRDSEGAMIMFTSDVSSRGLDYPNVTLVVQVGLPERGGTYINRIGRTGRSGKDGESLLLITAWEEFFLEKVQNQSIELSSAPEIDSLTEAKILQTLSNMDSMIRWHAYRTWLGYYASLTNLPLSKETIVSHANEFSLAIGFDETPRMSRNLIRKMGLYGVRGLKKTRRNRPEYVRKTNGVSESKLDRGCRGFAASTVTNGGS